MNSRNWVRMFLRTLFLGAGATLITSFFVQASTYMEYLAPLDLFQLLGVLIFFIGLGLVFSLVSQMGFFAYLTVNQLGLSMLKGFWAPLQSLLILFTLFDLVYFRYKASDGETSILVYLAVAVFLFVYGWVVSAKKANETNRNAFIPALFFMVVVTSIEWVPGLRTSGSDYSWLMIVPLLLYNTYQLLILHKLNDTKKEQS
ncbi:KinB-signaling pathway activation protein [Radiobacillus deserti]|uniref:KinB-signaling pathway activation protein n=1 Tax=Radiobacillus deserti TaxID=2594883 RepID=A0A516KC05_9BACI|nr:KinB-signaling pathway activation protein [Radiobacillus deserti]QDP38924.1 KinB-signaling pathway activation protein [Radiobacillus deserti]